MSHANADVTLRAAPHSNSHITTASHSRRPQHAKPPRPTGPLINAAYIDGNASSTHLNSTTACKGTMQYCRVSARQGTMLHCRASALQGIGTAGHRHCRASALQGIDTAEHRHCRASALQGIGSAGYRQCRASALQGIGTAGHHATLQHHRSRRKYALSAHIVCGIPFVIVIITTKRIITHQRVAL